MNSDSPPSSTPPAGLNGAETSGAETPAASPDPDPTGQSAAAREASGSFLDRLGQKFFRKDARDLRSGLEDALAADQPSSLGFSPEERAMLSNILRLREVRVDDVMIPRADIRAVDGSLPLGEVLKIFMASGHSRMPVYHDKLDHPLGMVHIKDVMSYMTKAASVEAPPPGSRRKPAPAGLDLKQIDLTTPLAELSIVRQLLYVPGSMPATDLMAAMQATRMQMALVVDEYGGTDGLVSIEDLVEEIVGDIEDEHDDEERALLEPLPDGSYTADARIDLDELTGTLGETFQIGDIGEDVDTLGGLLFTLLGRIPVRGELIDKLPGFEFEVTDADPRRIKRLRIYPAGMRRRDTRRRRGSSRTAETVAAPETAETETARKETGAGQV